MNLLRTIRQKDIGLSGETVTDYRKRYAARAVLKDSIGRVALLHSSKRNYYKLPGGGVEKGEDMSLALSREILEEVGATAVITGEIGRVEERRDDAEGLHQISNAYMAEVSGVIGRSNFTDSEIAEGFSIVWVDSIDEAIQKVGSATRNVDAGVKFMLLRDTTILKAAKEL